VNYDFDRPVLLRESIVRQDITGIDRNTDERTAPYSDQKLVHKVPYFRMINGSVRKLFELITSR